MGRGTWRKKIKPSDETWGSAQVCQDELGIIRLENGGKPKCVSAQPFCSWVKNTISAPRRLSGSPSGVTPRAPEMWRSRSRDFSRTAATLGGEAQGHPAGPPITIRVPGCITRGAGCCGNAPWCFGKPLFPLGVGGRRFRPDPEPVPAARGEKGQPSRWSGGSGGALGVEMEEAGMGRCGAVPAGNGAGAAGVGRGAAPRGPCASSLLQVAQNLALRLPPTRVPRRHRLRSVL